MPIIAPSCSPGRNVRGSWRAIAPKWGLPTTAHAFVQQLRHDLTTAAEAADTGYPENTACTITPQGEPVLKRPPATQQPASVLELEAAVQTRLPERHLLDVLWLVEQAVHYTRHFV